MVKLVRRKDFLHKLTTKLVRENQAIYTETLAVKKQRVAQIVVFDDWRIGDSRMANHKLSKAIADCGWGEALRQFQYKCKWHARTLGAIDRWFPSSKRCNPCGHILDKLPLDIREWTCPNCNNLNMRDQNAALNILAIGRSLGGFPPSGYVPEVGDVAPIRDSIKKPSGRPCLLVDRVLAGIGL